jgi:carboxypeptidase Q
LRRLGRWSTIRAVNRPNPFTGGVLLAIFLLWSGQSPVRAQTNISQSRLSTNDVVASIRQEGLHHSQVMETLTQITEVIGPRLTASPNLKRANEWARDQLIGWGLTNSHLEAWPFGRGWSLKRYSAEVVAPQCILLVGAPNAWSQGLEKPLEAEVVLFDAKSDENLEQYKGKLAGKIVLSGPQRELKPRYGPMGQRLTETNLLQLANAGPPMAPKRRATSDAGSAAQITEGRRRTRKQAASTAQNPQSLTNASGTKPAPEAQRPGGGRGRPQSRFLSFIAQEKAALVVNCSSLGEGGTFVVAGASVALAEPAGRSSATNTIRAWSTNAPTTPPQITLVTEDYNRLVRMIREGQKPRMAVELQVEFHDEDLMAYNTLAEIPGTDLKDEIVMLGAHLDSWHAGTGATDNGAGVAATMEAVRILKALKLQPRRTIRIALWSGEEQGLLGSKAYVARHFGFYTNTSPLAAAVRSPKDEVQTPAATTSTKTNSEPTRKLVRLRDYEKLSVYLNLDNGAGKIRGVYMEGNEAMRPLFRDWLEPFRDLGAETLSLSRTYGTDHQSFTAIGLPGFQFIQDPLDYGRTHHSNADVLDRIEPDDLKQASVILATLALDAANLEARVPRKPVD